MRRAEERLIKIKVLVSTQGAKSVAKTEKDETSTEVEEAQAALREGMERAKELICEAKLAMRQQKAEEPQPPNPAS
jgi:hypothetical protein